MAVNAKIVEEMLHREPFQPFRIITSSGKEYEVPNPGLVIVFKRDIFYAFPSKENHAWIPMMQVSSIEVSQQAA
jgi:hypothetical protein